MPHGAAFYTVQDLVESYRERLGLRWAGGLEGADRHLIPEEPQRFSLIGHLNFIHPHRIQVLGRSEVAYLESLGKNSFQDAIHRLLTAGTVACVIVAEHREAPATLRHEADEYGTPLLVSGLESGRLIDHIDYYLRDLMADKKVVHGVFMEVMDIGVLLTGASAVGKSELALELITRGHSLVADDAPEFTRAAPDALKGSCPEPLRDFIEVRGLGVLNVRSMFGDSAIKRSFELGLIVNLLPATSKEFQDIDRLEGSRHMRTILEVDIPEIHLPVGPGRNLAVLVEIAARNEILYRNGYDASEDFVNRQRRHLDTDEGQ